MNKKQRKWRNRILVALALFAVIFAVEHLLPLADLLGSETAAVYLLFALYLVPYLIAGHDVLLRAARNIKNGQVFDENLLMSIATIGAFAMIAFPNAEPSMAEGCAVMLFYQVGELFQSYAVGKSRKSIASMMDIAPGLRQHRARRRTCAGRPSRSGHRRRHRGEARRTRAHRRYRHRRSKPA